MGFLAIVNAPVVAFPSCAITFVHLLSNCHTQVCVDFPCRLSKHLARHTTGYTTGDTTANTAMEIATNASGDTSASPPGMVAAAPVTFSPMTPPELLQHLLAPSTPEGV